MAPSVLFPILGFLRSTGVKCESEVATHQGTAPSASNVLHSLLPPAGVILQTLALVY